jgi:K+-transporting ATPase ATPase C chain
VKADLEVLRRENPEASRDVPQDLVTTSASGLDPDLSEAAVDWQVPRIAKARGVSRDRISTLVGEHTEPRDLGFLGEPRVNVLLLNLALDRQFGKPVRTASVAVATRTSSRTQ